MTIMVEGKPYRWSRSDDAFMQMSTGGSADIEVSADGGATWVAVGSLPLTTGELQGQLFMRSCYFRCININGVVSVSPDVKDADI